MSSAPPLRILQAIHTVDPASGGPIEWVNQVSAELRTAGHEVVIVSLVAADAPVVAASPIPCHALGRAGGGYGCSPEWVPWLRRHLREYDAVIVNGLWQYQSFGTWRAMQGSPVPYFVFPHGMLDPWFKRTCPLKHLKKWLYWPWADYRVLRDAAAVIFTGEEERRLARQSFWLYRVREAVCPLGIAEPPRDRAGAIARLVERHPAWRGKRLLLYLGRIHPKKGPDLLLRAFASVAGGPGDAAGTAHLVMAGGGDPAYLAELAGLAVQLGVGERITWLGRVAGDDKWGAFAAADGFALPSHQENFAVAAVEALACGVPVLLSSQVGICREVEADGAGWVGEDTVAGTAALLARWWQSDPAERTARSRAARRCFENRFRIDRAARDLVRIMRR